MPVKPGEPLDPEATRARILEAAARVFYQRGIHAVGIAEIADAASASKLTIYKNFGSKDGLVEAVLRDRSDRVGAWLQRGLASVPPGRSRVLAVFDLLSDWYAEDDFRGCAMVNAATEHRGSGGAPLRLARQHLQLYRELLERCLSEAGAVDPPDVARKLLLLIEGATVVSAVDGDNRSGDDAREVAQLLLSWATRETVAA